MGAGGSKEDENTYISILQDIPDPVRGRVEKYFKEQQLLYSELKEKHEKHRVNSDQKYFELEKQLIETQGDLNVQTELASELKERNIDLEKKYGSTAQELRNLQQSEMEHGKQRDTLHRTKHSLEMEKRDLSDLVDRKTKEIDRLQEEWRQMSVRVNEANKTKIEAVAKKDEVQADFVKVEHQLSRQRQEKDMLNQQVTFLEATLKEKSGDLLNVRKENSSRVLELQAEVDKKVSELKHTQDHLQYARDSIEKLTESNEKYINKLEEMRNVQTFNEEQFRSQLQTQEKLISLYKKSASEAEETCKQFQKGAEEVQKLLNDAVKAREEIEELRREDSVRFDSVVKSKEMAIEKLETELKNANEFIEIAKRRGMAALSEESIEELSPSAAAASKLLKSGLTLTQIYSEYVQVSEKLVFEEEENKRLSQCLEAIMGEVEEKAPILKKQREDYERGVQTIELLTSQLDTAVREAERRQVESDETNRHCGEVMRENHRLKQQCMDLGTQVRMLLKELEQARGVVVTHSDDARHQSESAAQSVISDKLVTFRSIEELQEQNQKLLGVVRELSEQQEEHDEQGSADARTQQLTKRLEAAMEDIEEMRASRERQVQLTEAIVRQRDMYKALLAEDTQLGRPDAPMQTSTPGPEPRTPGSVPTTPRSATKSPQVVEKTLFEETKTALKEMQEEFNTYRKEKAENEKMLNEEIDKLREKCSELRVTAAKLSTQLTYAEERYKTVHSNIEKYKLEISALSDKNTKYAASVVKHEQTIAMMREDMMANGEKLTRAEVKADRLQHQCETLRAMEARMSQEKESVMREQRSQNLLLASLQAIQNNLERSEFETRTMLNNRIEQLEKENVLVKRKLEQAQDSQRAQIQSLEKQLVDAKELIGQEDQTHRKTESELRLARDKTHHQETQIKRLESQLEAAKARESQGPRPLMGNIQGNPEQLRTANAQLAQYKRDIASLEEQLQKSRRHAEQYKTISDTMERSLAESTKASKELEAKLEREASEAKTRAEESEKEVKSMDNEKQRLISENMRLTEEIKSSNVGLRQQVEALQTEVGEAVQRREAAIANEQKAVADLKEHVARANDSQDKYQRELMLHAADVNSLTKVKEELQEVTANVTSAQDSAKEATERLTLEKVSWAEQKKIMNEDRSRLQSRIAELQQQNEMLHDNLEKMSQQMVGIQKRKEKEDKDTAQLAEKVAKEPADKSAEQLLEVIKFLRKEKDIAETKLEVIQTESARYKHQAESLDKHLKEANKSIETEREKAQVSVQTAAQHADLLRKVENLNILQESNRMMREEKEGHLRKIRELDARIQQLEADIQPLQMTKRELGAQNDALSADCETYKVEINRWKARTNRLMEERIDPQEHQTAVKELAQTRQAVKLSGEEHAKARTELSQTNKQLSERVAQLNALNAKVKTLSEEAANTKTEIEAKDKDLEEKGKTINQLRNIGRKYRKQAEDTQKEIDSLKKQHEETLKVNVPEMQSKIKVAEDKLKNTEEQLKATQENLKTSETSNKQRDDRVKALEEERNVTVTKIKTMESEKLDFQKKLTDMEQKAKHTIEQTQKLTEELSRSKALEIQLKNDKEEVEKQKEVHRKIVMSAKTKLSSQKSEIETLKKENTELKQRVAGASQSTDESDQRLKALKSQYDAQLTRLRADLETSRTAQTDAQTARQELDAANKRVTELTQRVNQLQKLVEVYKSQISVTSTAPKVASPSVSTESPKTANIRPMTNVSAPTSTTQVRPQQGQAIQPVRSATSETRAPMASIRPMAVSTPVTAPSPAQQPAVTMVTSQSQTPTATVHPTTQDSDVTGPLQVVTSARPTQAVQAVSPQDLTTSSSQEPSSTSPAMPINQAATQGLTTPTSVSSSTNAPPTHEVMPSTSGSSVGSSGGLFGKRAREEGEQSPHTDQEQAPVKKSKTVESPITAEVSQSVDSQDESAAGTSQVDLTQDEEPSHDTSAATHEQSSEYSGDVVPGTSDMSAHLDTHSEEDTIEGEHRDTTETEVEDGVEAGTEEEQEYVEYGEEDEEETGIDIYPHDVEEIDDGDDDVVIVDDDDEPDNQAATQSAPMQPATHTAQQSAQQLEAQSSSSTVASQLSSSSSLESQRAAQFGAGIGRGAPSARSQLQPFIFGGEAGHIDLGDDGIVPSTPTLFVPKRNDGFAEAISSPQVGRQFVFGGASSADTHSQPDFGQLATQGGLDNPFIDLAQLEGSAQQQQLSVTSSGMGSQQVTALEGDTHSGLFDSQTQQQVVGSTSSAAEGISQPDDQELGQGEGAQSGAEADKSADSLDKLDSEQSKRKIEPIVWSDPSTSSGPATQSHQFPRQQSVPRYQSPPPQMFPQQQTGSPISTLGSSQYQMAQQPPQKRFPPQTARRGNQSFRGRHTGMRRRPPIGRGASPSGAGMQHTQSGMPPQQGVPRGSVRGGRVAKRSGPYRQQPF